MTLQDKILDHLNRSKGAMAKDIAHALGIERSDANSQLYKMKNAGRVVRDDNFQWSLVSSPTRSVMRDDNSVPATSRLPQPIPPAADLTSPSKFEWAGEQMSIIDAPFSARVLVEAGPGTGKTAVACARVAKLLREGVNPSSILMISFTRTAVAEMKNRIRILTDAGRVNAVQICTLDQSAFSFGIGCGAKFEKLMGSFEDNIQAAIEHFTRGDPLLLDYVHSFDHIIIDEAQDLVGLRSELAILLLGALRPDAGATIFADAAQAIYGFSTDVDGGKRQTEYFLQTFDTAATGFNTAHLTKIYRTSDPHIINLFTNSRKTLSAPHLNNSSYVQEIIDIASGAAANEGDEVKNLPLEDGDLLLYRKRASALMHAVFCPKLFRLRLPGHPPAIFPWLGFVFSNFTDLRISRTEFSNNWDASVPSAMDDGISVEKAWDLIYRFAGKRDDVDVARLRSLLSRPRPPVEFCQLDYGGVGPIFSTIHASKGREADRVFLMLPRNLNYLDKNKEMDPEEEARIFYVGSTRVRKQFLRGFAKTIVQARRLEGKGERVVQICADDKLKFQVGLVRDFDDLAPISRDPFYCSDANEARRHQDRIVADWQKCLNDGASFGITAAMTKLEGADQWPYRFVDGDKQTLAWSAPKFNHDLWKMNELVQEKFGGQRRPPTYINHLRMIGLRTRVLGENPAPLGRIHEPFASTGFWLAPMIVGFQSVKFPERKHP